MQLFLQINQYLVSQLEDRFCISQEKNTIFLFIVLLNVKLISSTVRYYNKQSDNCLSQTHKSIFAKLDASVINS